MTNPIWDGYEIDPSLLTGYGYSEHIDSSSGMLPRYIAYQADAIAECGHRVTAAATQFVGTSSASLTITAVGTTPTLVAQTGKAWAAGMIITVIGDQTTQNYMVGSVVSYNSGTGALSFLVLDVSGAGTFSNWLITLSGRRGALGAQGINGTPGLDGATGPAGSGSNMNFQSGGITVTVAPRPLLNFQNSLRIADNVGSTRGDADLVGDVAAPGNAKHYGTDAGGTRGWIDTTAAVAAVVPFASNAEAIAGTMTNRAMTPASSVAGLAGRVAVEQVFTASGTYNKNPKATVIIVIADGGGGSGTTGNFGNPGQGGFGAERIITILSASEVTSPVAVTVGAGGVAIMTYNTRINGGDSRFGNFLIARGGNPSWSQLARSAGILMPSGDGGSGGYTSGNVAASGSRGFFLGNSTNGIPNADGAPGAAAVGTGSGGGPVTAGNGQTPATKRGGGAGGGGATYGDGGTTSGSGGNGAIPGGGGGGGGSCGTGWGEVPSVLGIAGNGGRGEVRVIEILGG